MKTLKVKISELKHHFNLDILFNRLYAQPYPFYLRSSMTSEPQFYRGEPLGRYSFIGANPFLVLKSKGHKIFVETSGNRDLSRHWRDRAGRTKGNRIYSYYGNPFEELKKILDTYRITQKDYPVPFVGGGVGYFSYDLCHFVEKLPRTARDDLKFPDMFFAFYDRIFACDHKKNKVFLIGLNHTNFPLRPVVPEDTFPDGYRDKTKTTLLSGRRNRKFSLKSNFTKSAYLKAIRRAKEYITAGDIYQMNLSQRFEVKSLVDSPQKIFSRLNQINPAPFSAFLQPVDGQSIISSSPERFLRIRNRHVETRPIKGTRPRGKNPAQDRRLKQELYHSVKDNAELAMIVDLERNDLGRVCRYGSVKVAQSKGLETYPTVFHLVATIEGDLHPRYNAIDLIKATFPGGSITGAPKIRAMEIIDELEPTQRNVYTGAIGYLGFDGTIDLSIAIRIFMINKNGIYFQAGGGLVADSDPESEYQETIAKVKGLIKTLNLTMS